MNSIVMRGQSNLVWMDNLKNNRFPTGNTRLDEIIHTYGLKKSFYSNLFQPNLVVLHSKINYNLEALACLLETVYGVSGIQPEFLHGDGNDITDSIQGETLFLIYSYGWDNCRNNCKYKRFWKLSLAKNGQVDYLGSWGDKLEPGLNLSMMEGENNFPGFKLYPNPAKDLLYTEGTEKDLHLTITNYKGEVVFSRSALQAHEVLDVAHLLMGTYELKLESGGKRKIYSLQKNFYPRQGE